MTGKTVGRMTFDQNTIKPNDIDFSVKSGIQHPADWKNGQTVIVSKIGSAKHFGGIF
jgi:hypothetical protein